MKGNVYEQCSRVVPMLGHRRTASASELIWGLTKTAQVTPHDKEGARQGLTIPSRPFGYDQV